MGSQFVDFNADGHLDYLTATFDGSPHIAYGSPEGFGKPERLKDAKGERIIIASIWNYDDRQHQTLGRAFDTDNPPKERCISALAFDWDGDGDHDLLLGSYENGHLYRQMNEGTNKEPKFTGKNIPVMAGGEEFAIPGKMTAPRLVDWDGDGDLDLIAGSFGDSYSQGTGGAVYLSRNNGVKGKPAFGELETLIPPSSKGQSTPTRPGAGLYADAVDYDGDGDLDLVVGGYSMWTPKPRELSKEEKAEATRLKKQLKEVETSRNKLYQKISTEAAEAIAGMDSKSKEARTKRSEVYTKYRDQTSAAYKEFQAVKDKLEKLVPGPQRKTFVWLYERQQAGKIQPASASAARRL